MLLPSDVARLVLGYLQEEGLSATSRAFIHESPNLREYADHTTGDGAIPACVFSLFGKGLTTILNEYVAVKTKESRHDVPVMMSSLWKKLDFTLNQIKSLQNSPSLSACQRVRSRVEMENMARQQALTLLPAGGPVCSSIPETSSIISPVHTSHNAFGHSTPVSFSDPPFRPGFVNRTLSTPRDSPVHIIVSEHRLNSGPMSPGRRKWDTPRKRSGALGGSSGQSRPAATTSSLTTEPQAEEGVDENFPQLVIQSARDKILGDRSLQEKLAENINKILANEPAPQTSKASMSTVEEDQSIDEILGLQGEIHMSDDAIHDILEQTESDPAFQALFDLFDYNKNKFTDGDGDDVCNILEEGDTAGPSATVRPAHSDDPGATQTHTNASDATSATQKMRPGQERKNRKTTAPTLIKKIIISSNGRSSRIENNFARLLVTPAATRDVPPANTNRMEKASLLINCADVTPMDLDEPLNTPPPPVDDLVIQEPITKHCTNTTYAPSVSTPTVSSGDAGVTSMPEVEPVSNVGKKQETKRAQALKEKPAAVPSSALSSQPVFLSPAPVQLNKTPAQTSNLVEMSVSCSETFSTCTSTGATVPLSCSSTATPLGSTSSASPSTTLATTPALSTPASSCPLAVPSLDCLTTNPSTVNKALAGSSDIVSLKIIVSDNHEEDSSTDTALTQAISSITGEKMPTIYLSSPAKSPGGPATPRATSDEVAQAVNGLQISEVHASPLSYKAAALIASSSTATSQAQQNFIIQLPLDTSNSALQGASASYIFVAEPSTTDAQTTQMLLPAGVTPSQPLPASQYGLNTQTQAHAFSSGSALILPSPVKPLMLPVSVVGQNTVQMVSSQLVAIPNPVVVQQTENGKPKPPTGKTKQSAPAGGRKIMSKKGDQSGSSHRRILCFEPPPVPEPETAKAAKTSTPANPNTSTSQSAQQPEKETNSSVSRTKPAILGGNKPKRRVETVRCSAEPLAGGGFVNPFQNQKDVRKSSRKQDHNSFIQESCSENVSSAGASQPETVKKSQSEKRSKSIDGKHKHDSRDDASKGKDAHRSRSLSSDSAQKSGSKKDKEDGGRKEPADKPLKSREGRPEKKAPSQTVPNVTANKENEIKGSVKEQNQPSAPSSSASRDFSPSTVAQPASNTQSKTTKASSKTSSLAKQAAEMLQDIQGLNSPSTPSKRPDGARTEQSLPGPGRNQETLADCPGTPSRQKKGKEVEGTPKHVKPPNTPDVPTCSPASEAGSESSINMAAHTLMILSRAAIARTGTPLKDSLRQEGAGENSPAGSTSKKRKQSSPTSSPPPKKEAKSSPGKKKDRERKKLIDCFPLDLDVDKFLSSLHYDE